MKKLFTNPLLIVLLGGGIALSGCNKTSEAIKPVAATVSQNDEGEKRSDPPTPEQLKQQSAWLWYVEELESGRAVDPSGQYVKKSTVFSDSTTKDRAMLPKFDATDGKAGDWGFHEYTANRPIGNPTQPPCADCTTDLQPPTGNPTGNGPAGGAGTTGTGNSTGNNGSGHNYYGGNAVTTGAPVSSIFVTSVGLGGAGRIRDLKLAASTSPTSNSSSVDALSGTGYIRLAADLNEGAGGDYIWYYFTRDANAVIVDSDQGEPYFTAQDFVSDYYTYYGNVHFPPNKFNDHLAIHINGSVRYDLNSGAGGEYIWSYQAKNPTLTQNTSYVISAPYFSEIGIIFGNSSVIQPPSGWIKHPKDLNAGAGGDFIYFCYKY